MAADAQQAHAAFDPASFQSFRFVSRDLDPLGRVTLRYALDERISFVEEFDLPVQGPLSDAELGRVEGLLSLLHWVAGVSYFKTAAPAEVLCETGSPTPAVAALLEALYSEGLGEFAFTNALPALPRPRFPTASATASAGAGHSLPLERVLVPVGGGKDSAVALEIVRRSGREVSLFSIGNATPIARTVAVAGLPHLMVSRRLDPGISQLNAAGALNGHIPITAIVSCVALLTAALHGFDGVAMANERSASAGNLSWDGIEVNHQFSKGLAAESLLSAAVAELGSETRIFSVLRPASELAIARAFARMDRYHDAFTSCNAIFRLDPALRAASWCCDCPKCRFVFLDPRALHHARPPARGVRPRPARGRGPVRGLCPAQRHRRAQAVRVRGRGAGEPRRHAAVGGGSTLARAPGCAEAGPGGATAAWPGRRSA